MSGMEIAGVALGGPGAVPLIVKSLELWKSIADANTFGSDMAETLAKLSMQVNRFYAWARASGIFENAAGANLGESYLENIQNGIYPDGTAQTEEDAAGEIIQMKDVIKLDYSVEDAIASIFKILEEVEKILKKYGIEYEISSLSSSNPVLPEPQTSSMTFNFSDVPALLQQRKDVERSLQKRNSFKARFVFSTKPWGTSNKEALQEKLASLIHWNNELERLLPKYFRSSIREQGVPGQVLREENKDILDMLIRASENGKENDSVKQHCELWKLKLKFELGSMDNESMEKYRAPDSSLFTNLAFSKTLEIHSFRERKDLDPRFFMVEKYNHGSSSPSTEDLALATGRLAQLVYLASHPNAPRSLRLLKALSFVEEPSYLGLLYEIPTSACKTKLPESLSSLLLGAGNKRAALPRPALGARIQLAQQLSSAIYSYSLVRWFHKAFNSEAIVFFWSSQNNDSLLLSSPYIIGFSIARPDKPTERSINNMLNSEDLHLHPSLRSRPLDQRPRYQRRFEIWSLAVLLLEVGLWRPIGDIVRRPQELSPEQYGREVRRRVKDLPFYMGDRYAEVVEKCFAIGDGEEGEDFDYVFWSVVYTLLKCP